MVMRIQRKHISEFAESHGFEVKRTVWATLTNRDRHFAETREFGEAVRAAAECGGPIVLGDVLALLSATTPQNVLPALFAALGAGVPVIDAVAEATIKAKDIARLVRHGRIASSGRRAHLRQDPKHSSSMGAGRAENQTKATRGSSSVANAFAVGIKPIVDDIKGKLPAGSGLGPSALALELNSRGIFARRGGTWSATTARDLLRRLEAMSD